LRELGRDQKILRKFVESRISQESSNITNNSAKKELNLFKELLLDAISRLRYDVRLEEDKALTKKEIKMRLEELRKLQKLDTKFAKEDGFKQIMQEIINYYDQKNAEGRLSNLGKNKISDLKKRFYSLKPNSSDQDIQKLYRIIEFISHEDKMKSIFSKMDKSLFDEITTLFKKIIEFKNSEASSSDFMKAIEAEKESLIKEREQLKAIPGKAKSALLIKGENKKLLISPNKNISNVITRFFEIEKIPIEKRKKKEVEEQEKIKQHLKNMKKESWYNKFEKMAKFASRNREIELSSNNISKMSNDDIKLVSNKLAKISELKRYLSEKEKTKEILKKFFNKDVEQQALIIQKLKSKKSAKNAGLNVENIDIKNLLSTNLQPEKVNNSGRKNYNNDFM